MNVFVTELLNNDSIPLLYRAVERFFNNSTAGRVPKNGLEIKKKLCYNTFVLIAILLLKRRHKQAANFR